MFFKMLCGDDIYSEPRIQAGTQKDGFKGGKLEPAFTYRNLFLKIEVFFGGVII